jgi:hypothetical protein
MTNSNGYFFNAGKKSGFNIVVEGKEGEFLGFMLSSVAKGSLKSVLQQLANDGHVTNVTVREMNH